MSLQIAAGILAAGFYLLALLVLANWHDLARDRKAMVKEEPIIIDFVNSEIQRIRLRFFGWLILGFAVSCRLLLQGESYQAYVILGGSILAVGLFGVEGIIGRLERRRVLRGG